MNPTSAVKGPPTCSGAFREKIADLAARHWDLIAWTLLLAAVNLPLLGGSVNFDLIYFSEAVHQGQWWRVLFFPLVHLSWYHLLLDGGAFLLLYNGLEEKRLSLRLLLVAGCSASSLLAGLWLAGGLVTGLAGLSGIAHGLMAFSGLEMMRRPEQRRLGMISLGLVVVKSIYEVTTGSVVFAFMHMGLCGQPVAACHAGGVAGGMLLFAIFTMSKPSNSAQGAREKLQ